MPSARTGSATVCRMMSPRFVDCAVSASAKIDSATVGSVSATTVISRLAPIPPNGEPVSRPASARKKVPSRSRYTTANRSPMRSYAVGTNTSGTSEATATLVPNKTNGAARKTHDAVFETTRSFANSLRSST